MLTQVTSLRSGCLLKNLDVRIEPETLAGASCEKVARDPHAAAHVERTERLAAALGELEFG